MWNQKNRLGCGNCNSYYCGTYCGRYTGNAFISYGAAKSSPIYGCQSGFYSLITSPILLTISSFSKGFVINFLAPVFNASISLDC